MEYITITSLAIAATTFLVYLLANKVFGVRLRLKSLALCAACALFLSLVLPRIVVSFAGFAGTVGLLAVCAIIFAYFVAYYDDPHDLQTAGPSVGPRPKPEPTTMVVAAPAATAMLAAREKEPVAQPAPEAVTVAVEPIHATVSQSEGSAPAVVPEPEEPGQTGLELELELNLIAERLSTQPAVTENENGDEAPLIVLPAARAVPVAAPPATIAVAAEDETAATTEEPEPETAGPSPVTPDPLVTYAFAVDDFEPEPSAVDKPAAALNDALTKEAPKLPVPPLPASDSLDDLIEFAFAHKDAGHHQQALDAFRRVLRLYRFSEAAPFAAIEIANLLKNKGAYDEAIAVLTESRNLLALVKNEDLDQEFVVTIAFLRIVKNTLLQRRVGYVPFGRIPPEINREIDAEFREWRNLAAN